MELPEGLIVEDSFLDDFATASSGSPLCGSVLHATSDYRAIREDAFHALRIRGRYVVPAEAILYLSAQATERGGCLDIARLTRKRHLIRQIGRAPAYEQDQRSSCCWPSC